MTPAQEAKLDEVLDRLTDREQRGYLAREVDVTKQAVGRMESSGLARQSDVPSVDQIADAVVSRLPVGTVSPGAVAKAVADELKRRL